MLLKELLAGDAVWAAQQRKRAADNIWSNVPPYLSIIVCKPFLRDAFVRPVDPIGVRELDRAPLLRRRLGTSSGDFAHDLAGRLVFAQAAERGVPQMTIGGPGPELNFGNKLGTDIFHLSRLICGQPRAKRA